MNEILYFTYLQEEYERDCYYEQEAYLNTCDELNETLLDLETKLAINLIVGV